MKYFTKYIPVEGRPEPGDIIIKDGKLSKVGCHGLGSATKWKKAKLFVCSRDIEVGDKVNGDIDAFNLGIVTKIEGVVAWVKENTTNREEDWMKSSLYKVVGEVSPGAIWVKEGDEFEREELFAHGVGHNWSEEFSGSLKFKIKCPTCKSFH